MCHSHQPSFTVFRREPSYRRTPAGIEPVDEIHAYQAYGSDPRAALNAVMGDLAELECRELGKVDAADYEYMLQAAIDHLPGEFSIYRGSLHSIPSGGEPLVSFGSAA